MSTYTADQDPADFTVDQVTAFLVTADAETTGTVKALEDAGKQRVGIMTYTPTAHDVKPDADGYSRVLVEDAYQPGAPIERDANDDAEGDDTQA